MTVVAYWTGIVFAISSGVLNNIGTILQKKVINDLPDNVQLMNQIIRKPLWLFGLFLQYGLGLIVILIAQVFIGPALIPGLMAAGLIVLAIGSVMIVNEKLNKSEILGIFLMIGAIFLLGLSELSIDIVNVDLLDWLFIARVAIFTISLFLVSIFCEIIARRKKRYGGIVLAIFSGLMVATSNFWIAALMTALTRFFTGTASWVEFIWLIIAIIIFISVNILAIIKISRAFQLGQASNLIPIQQVPIQLSPIFIYFFVFLLIAPNILSIAFLVIGIVLILMSSILLAKRQTE
ncbi:MAG: DMT family transporter [Promethearchaeota archaeon]